MEFKSKKSTINLELNYHPEANSLKNQLKSFKTLKFEENEIDLFEQARQKINEIQKLNIVSKRSIVRMFHVLHEQIMLNIASNNNVKNVKLYV